ncbi:MAG: outer membrane protein assembly factor BamD [Desulfobulbaceae bacterium]|nr:outer membrane protein assembly factor BamD [Desulfobulbaceae bacterium]
MHKLLHTFILIAMAAGLLFLPGCSIFNDIKGMFGDDSNSVQSTPESLAMDALDKFNHGQYSSALKLFNEIEERFPFSSFSLMADLKSADCHYYLKHYAEAISTYEEFITNHPTNEAIPYVLFQIGMCYYKQIDTIDRDPGSALDAESAFGKLLRLYPQTPYTEEARARIQAARDFLANHEMYVASFYLKTDKLKQCTGRLEYLLDNYPDTSVAPEAEKLLALVQAGTPPKSSWKDWIPEIGLPDWQIFKDIGVMKPTM